MAGNGRKARGRDVANRVRDAFNKALDEMEATPGGVIELKELLVVSLTEDPLKTLDTLSKYIPKEMMIEQTDPNEKGVFLAQPMAPEEWNERYGGETTH